MGIEKTKWRELGLTPRQLSKKLGVTCSMAEFIAQSYRVPVNVEGPQVACTCSPCRQESPKKKVKCTCNTVPKSRFEKASDPCSPCWSRKRKSEEKLSDCDDSSAASAWNHVKEVHEATGSSSCEPQSITCCPNNCYKICTSTCYRCPSVSKRYKSTPRRKPRCTKPKRKPDARRKKTTRARTRKTVTCSKTVRRVPLTLCLKVPVNIYLDEKDGVVINKDDLTCMTCQAACSAAQQPLLQEYMAEHMRDKCEEPNGGHLARQQEAEDESVDETDQTVSEEYVLSNKGCISVEKVDCNLKAVVKDNRQLSWWETFQECVAYLESFLASLINKC